MTTNALLIKRRQQREAPLFIQLVQGGVAWESLLDLQGVSNFHTKTAFSSVKDH